MAELPVYQPKHAEIAATELPGPFLDQGDFQSLLAVYSLRIQEIEDFFQDLIVAYDLDNDPTGEALRQLGAAWELTWDRTQLTDAQARLLLDAWIAGNNATGTLDEMYGIWDTLGELDNVVAHTLPQGVLWVWDHSGNGYFEQRVLEVLHRVSTAGVDETFLAIIDNSTVLTLDHVSDISAGNTTPGLGPDWIQGHGLSNATMAEVLQTI